MKLYNHLYMGNLKSALATLGAVSLAACGNAEAKDTNNAPVKAELAKMEAVVKVTKVTRKQCIALLPDKDQLKACMVELSAQNKAEIAAKTAQREESASEIAIIDKATETEQEANDLRRTTNVVLRERERAAEKSIEARVLGNDRD